MTKWIHWQQCFFHPDRTLARPWLLAPPTFLELLKISKEGSLAFRGGLIHFKVNAIQWHLKNAKVCHTLCPMNSFHSYIDLVSLAIEHNTILGLYCSKRWTHFYFSELLLFEFSKVKKLYVQGVWIQKQLLPRNAYLEDLWNTRFGEQLVASSRRKWPGHDFKG